LAPGAELVLLKIESAIDLEEAVDWLIAEHPVQPISTSIGWHNLTPGDGTGFFADLVARARAAQITWVTAAGNNRLVHWSGTFTDPTEDRWHNFAGAQNVNYFGPGNGDAYLIPAGVPLELYLRWDDWADANQDYDLFLMRWNGVNWTPFASSVVGQTGETGITPTEQLSVLTAGAPTAYGVMIRRFLATRDVHFDLFAPGMPQFDKSVPSYSLADLADAPDAITVAALAVDAPYAQELYSSEGPTNGPGGHEPGGIVKPDLAAYTNVSTVAYGPHNFAGTSAATPHVTGALALVMGAHPDFTPEQARTYLEANAIDMGTPGRDTQYGFGRLTLGPPPQPTLAIEDVTVPEGDSLQTAAMLTLSLDNSTSATVTVHYKTVDGSATADADYAAAAGQLTFASGTVSQTITILVTGDQLVEPDEQFFVQLSDATNATISRDRAQVVIQNDDQSTFDSRSLKPGETTIKTGGAWFAVHTKFTNDSNGNSYTVYEHGPTMDGPWTSACGNGVAGKSGWRICTISGLTPGIEYYIRVTHHDPDGVDGLNPVVMQTPLRVPSSSNAGVTIQPLEVEEAETYLLVRVPIGSDANMNSQLERVEIATAIDGPWLEKCGPYTSFAPKLCRVHGLAQGTDYWVRATVSDPDGVLNGDATQVVGPVRYTGLENLALGKAVTADAGWGCCTNPNQLTDGRIQYLDWFYGFAWQGGTARWGGGEAGWKQATIDLGEQMMVDRTDWWTHDPNSVPLTWKVSVSLDGVNFSDVFTTSEPRCRTSSQPLDVHWRFPSCAHEAHFAPVAARYVPYAFDDRTLLD
ncbi:MAG: S8 family serine peptidase, partial [Caldilineaceae bacterium]|nr:S8 family serine peptidase [Caldilineaceae bacterium]